MRPIYLILLCLSLLALPVLAVEDVTVEYTYEGDHGIDFSAMSKGPLKIGNFSDSRSNVTPELITDQDLGTGNGGYQAQKALAELVRDAIIQGFDSGNAELVESGEKLTLSGEILSTEAKIVARDNVDNIQLTLRANVKLQGSGRTIWQTTIFGRGTAPMTDGMEAAMKNALDQMVDGLVNDDYFLLEVL